jgi:hypothetical protein
MIKPHRAALAPSPIETAARACKKAGRSAGVES